MAAVYFTTIPCEPNTANRRIRSHIFGEIPLCTNNIEYGRFEVFRTFSCNFISLLGISDAKDYG